MIVRNITAEDTSSLAELLSKDEHHKDTTTDFFFQEGTKSMICESNDKKHMMCVRCSNSLRLDIQFDNNDKLFNAKTIIEVFPKLCAWAKSKGFTEVVFCSNSPELIAFLNKKFGFESVPNEFRVPLKD